MSAGAEVARRARALVGTRFRPQGRSATYGLDCVGLVVAAAGVSARSVPEDYRLRTDDADRIRAGLHKAGFAEACGERRVGDVLVVRAGFSQLHLVVLTEGGFVHADAGLGRVAEVPGEVGWPVLCGWRMPEPEAGVPGIRGAEAVAKQGRG